MLISVMVLVHLKERRGLKVAKTYGKTWPNYRLMAVVIN